MRKPLLALFLLTAALPAAAQSVPSTVNYQGRLTDNTPAQAPLTATVNMRFELWDCASCSTPSPDQLWVEPASGTVPVAVTGGIFSVMLGGNGVPLPAALFAGGTQRYLQLVVNGEALAPRQLIGATGYAAQAENAASAATAATATTATTAQTANNSLQLGGVGASGYQLATSTTCAANQFLSSITAGGATTCATPTTVIPLPLNLTGADPGPLVHVTQTGAGQGLWVDSTANASAVLGFNAGLGKGGNFQITSATNGNYALYGATTGTGSAGMFRNDNTANSNPALYVDTTGTGDAIVTYSPAHNGVTGQSNNPNNSGVYGANYGAGYGVAGATTSDIAAGVLGTNYGAGPAILGNAVGTGSAGYFVQYNTTDYSGPAVEAIALGKAQAIQAIASGGYPVINAQAGGLSDGLYATASGNGDAGVFQVYNQNNNGTGSAVVAMNNGLGRGADISIDNPASAADALFVQSNGTGTIAHFRSLNPQATPLLVEANGAGQTASLQSWSLGGTVIASLSSAGVFTGNGAGLSNLNTAALTGGPASINITGNAGSVTNGVYTTGNYADPSWLTALAGTKIVGSVASALTAGGVTNGVYTTGNYTDPAWIIGLSGSKITGSVANATNAANAGNAATVTNGVYTTGSYADPAFVASLSGSKIFGSVANATNATNATNAGNATTVTNGIYSTGSYSDPSWLTALAGSKITGSVTSAASAGTATTVTNGVYTTGSYSDPAWLTGLAGSKISGSVANATNAGNATTVTNGVYTTGSYADPAWLTGLAGGKISGAVATATNSQQLGLIDASLWQRALSSTSCGAGSFYTAINQAGVASCANAQASLTAPLSLSGNVAGGILTGTNAGLGIGVSGVSTVVAGTAYGVEGTNATNGGAGVYGLTSGTNGNGTIGEANNGASAYGVWGKSTSGYAGNFTGKVNISSNLSVVGTVSKGGGSFKIDHPLDPANKYLYHSFVESPDMMNIYNGNIVTDAKGEAVVVMPDWFSALNRDFRYQLTVIGEFAQAIVGRELEGNRFTIRTSKPGVKVSWQVTGIRHDDFANAHRIPVEEEKPAGERGTYLHPVEHGQPAEKALEAVKNRARERANADEPARD